MRRSALLLVVSLALVLTTVVPVGAATEPQAVPPPDPGARIDVVVIVDPGADVTTVGDEIETVLGVDADVLAVDDGLGMLAASVEVDAVGDLPAVDGVESAGVSRPFELLLAESSPAIGAPDLHAAGRTGAGAEVAVIDTGVDASLPGVDVVRSEERRVG